MPGSSVAGATHLIMLIASLGALAVIQNIIAAIYSPDILNFPTALAGDGHRASAALRLDLRADRHAGAQPPAFAVVMWLTQATRPRQAHPRRRIQSLPRRDHPHASPAPCYVYVMAIASAVVCIAGCHGAARSRPAALWRRHFAAHRHHRHDRRRRRQPHRRLPAPPSSSSCCRTSRCSSCPVEWTIGITFFIFVVFMLSGAARPLRDPEPRDRSRPKVRV